jgi:hypothetical protein
LDFFADSFSTTFRGYIFSVHAAQGCEFRNFFNRYGYSSWGVQVSAEAGQDVARTPQAVDVVGKSFG